MKPLLDILFKWAILLTLGILCIGILMLLSLIMWNIKYFIIADDIKEQILN